MQVYTEPINRLIEEFSKLPGVGRKTAQRLAFHVINMNNNDVETLSKAILDAKKEIKYCSICCNITDKDPCSMCSNKNRDSHIICVVEDPRDVAAMERTKEFKGQYHVLNGVISPMDGIGPDMIRIRELPKRSYLIGAPNGFGKTSFVNECIITLRKQGFRTVPYITLWELAQIRADNEQRITNPYQKFEKNGDKVVYKDRPETDEFKKKPEIVTNSYSYSEYINADCLFVGFTNILSKEIESYTLYQLLAIRGAKGLPTIVTISTSIEIYETDPLLKEYVWDEIKNYDENKYCYDRVYHVSCYKRKAFAIDSRDENVDNDTGIVG